MPAGTPAIVDGHLRRDAAVLLKRAEVSASLVPGIAAELRQLAIAANVAQGLPLSLRDRRVSVRRLLNLARTLSS